MFFTILVSISTAAITCFASLQAHHVMFGDKEAYIMPKKHYNRGERTNIFHAFHIHIYKSQRYFQQFNLLNLVITCQLSGLYILNNLFFL